MFQLCLDFGGQSGVGSVTLFDREALFEQLRQRGLTDWASELRRICSERFHPSKHGNLDKWTRAWQSLPECQDASIDASGDAVTVRGSLAMDPRHVDSLTSTLMQMHPWRKGPFDFFGVSVDTEWRSNWKWDRLAESLDFRGKSVLDVGCGNGYYGWRMIDAGADWVLGCDPYLLYVMQFEAMRRYAAGPEKHFIVPLADTDLPSQLQAFDLTLSMGVLYHRTSPIDHLQTLAETLKPGGQVVVETLVIESDEATVLVPEDRYAKMRNVWFIPSVPMLTRWLDRSGFTNIDVIDVTATTPSEQRGTPWMTFHSLVDFLDPVDPSRTVEGYPSPVRAIVVATKS
ncbi:tRNA 5-methoxyuridine(34)/uridine 5-oxyacetic acid(34) synthase CmoB [Novipirellula sp.]|uniref:tRNA 5-methoxyuridine(34)/uridine 5-oxyacetic acid(34) synthase CmoB n=1 Tax=Novipirellula sp. TaxID=2795430 RepID=UPI0035637746